MLGFLKKDLYMLYGAYSKNLGLVFLLYAAITLATKQGFLLSMMVFMSGFYSLSLLSMDDACGWNRYARTLPVSSGAIVTARCLAALSMLGVGVVFAALVGAAMRFVLRADVEDLALTVAVTVGVTLVTTGLMLPASYKWGVEKTRNTMMLLFVVVFVGPVLLKDRLNLEQLRLVAVRLEGTPPAAIGAMCVGAGLVVFALGGLLSWRIYRNKEF